MLLSKYEQEEMQARLENKKIRESRQEIIDKAIEETREGLKNNIFHFNIPDFFNGLRSYDELDAKIKQGYRRNTQIDKLKKIETKLQEIYKNDVNVFEYLAYLRLTTTSKVEMNNIIKNELNIEIFQPSFQIFFTTGLGYDVHQNYVQNSNQNTTNDDKNTVDIEDSVQEKIQSILRKNFPKIR